ncbi:hypothetical protein D3C76_689810 [compost metagenome]
MEIFNSPIEFGARLLLLLSKIREGLSLDQLVFFDYAMIYSADFEDETSIHPSLPHRLAELVRRREDVHDALTLYLSKGLVTSSIGECGIRYLITHQGCDFADNLSSAYHNKIKRQANWIMLNKTRLSAEMEQIFKMERAAN